MGFAVHAGEAHIYMDGETRLEGYLAVPADAGNRKLPAVVVVHQWRGLGDYEKKRAEMLADLGYVAFAADIYGQGVRASNHQEASRLATLYRGDRDLMKQRARAAVDEIKGHANVDPNRVAAIGYCFGGGVVLELARNGADIQGVVSFHGNLDTPDPSDPGQIKASILVCHGAADQSITQQDVVTFVTEMEAAKVDWLLVQYAGAPHAFTHFDSDRYRKKADQRSWEHMQDFLAEVFGLPVE